MNLAQHIPILLIGPNGVQLEHWLLGINEVQLGLQLSFLIAIDLKASG